MAGPSYQVPSRKHVLACPTTIAPASPPPRSSASREQPTPCYETPAYGGGTKSDPSRWLPHRRLRHFEVSEIAGSRSFPSRSFPSIVSRPVTDSHPRPELWSREVAENGPAPSCLRPPKRDQERGNTAVAGESEMETQEGKEDVISGHFTMNKDDKKWNRPPEAWPTRGVTWENWMGSEWTKNGPFNSIPGISFPIHFLLKSYSVSFNSIHFLLKSYSFPIHFLFCLIQSYSKYLECMGFLVVIQSHSVTFCN